MVKEKVSLWSMHRDSNPRSSDYTSEVLPLRHTFVNPLLLTGTFIRKVAAPHSPDEMTSLSDRASDLQLEGHDCILPYFMVIVAPN